MPVGEIKCWTCGKTGHYASDCKSGGPKFAFAPKPLKMNLLQEIADQVQEYSEGVQNPTEGITVNTVNRKEHCAQTIISELEDRRARINSTKSITAVVKVENRTRWWWKQRYTQKVPTRNIWYISRKRMSFQTQDH